MKVVRELVWYLNGKRLLAPEDLRFLRRRGFIDLVEEVELLEPHAARPAEDALDEDGEDGDGAAVFHPRVRHRRTFRKAPVRLQPGAWTLSARVLALWPLWAAELSGFGRLAEGVAGARPNADRLGTLCRLSEPALDALLKTAIAAGSPPLAQLWRGVGFHGYHGIGAALGLRGGSAVALREILNGRRRGEMGRYAAVLRYPGLARLYLLIQAQRSVLSAFGRLMACDPPLFDRALFARAYHPGCYWALTMLASAHLASPGDWPLRVHPPARPLPQHAQLSEAYACAVAMDRRRLARWPAGSGALPPLRCPCSWDWGYCAEATGRAA